MVIVGEPIYTLGDADGIGSEKIFYIISLDWSNTEIFSDELVKQWLAMQ